MQRINRFPPGLPVSAMQTYALASPARTHYRPATCAEVECEAWRVGWATVVDEGTGLGQQQAAYIRATMHDMAKPGRPADGQRWYSESRESHPMQDGTGSPAGAIDGLTTFTFPAGQPCFAAAAHQVPLERPCLYLVRGGDWRANTGLIRRHNTAEAWADDLHTTTDRLLELHERG